MNIETAKQKLQEEFSLLEKELHSVGRINPENPKDWEAEAKDTDLDPSDPMEIADSITELEGNTAILKQLEIRYNEVKEALERVKNGTFGKCLVCGKEIEEARLEINPPAKTCAEHKNQ
ncbi:MAG: TraR/DksA C4-type zinc finger protein [Patescibacteria group bacterium]